MRGFEIRFGNNTIRIAENEQTATSVIVEKVRERLGFHCGGFVVDKNLHLSWYHGYLKLGDEIIIEREEIEKSSEPIITASASGLTAEELTERKLKDFRVLENQLKEKGLI
jgi:hypothetical protein